MTGETNLYFHFGSDGELLYIGISLSAIQRLMQHRDKSNWFSDIARVEIKKFATRQEALIAEREAIKNAKPRFNIQHAKTEKPPKPPKPIKRDKYYLEVGTRVRSLCRTVMGWKGEGVVVWPCYDGDSGVTILKDGFGVSLEDYHSGDPDRNWEAHKAVAEFVRYQVAVVKDKGAGI